MASWPSMARAATGPWLWRWPNAPPGPVGRAPGGRRSRCPRPRRRAGRPCAGGRRRERRRRRPRPAASASSMRGTAPTATSARSASSRVPSVSSTASSAPRSPGNGPRPRRCEGRPRDRGAGRRRRERPGGREHRPAGPRRVRATTTSRPAALAAAATSRPIHPPPTTTRRWLPSNASLQSASESSSGAQPLDPRRGWRPGRPGRRGRDPVASSTPSYPIRSPVVGHDRLGAAVQRGHAGAGCAGRRRGRDTSRPGVRGPCRSGSSPIR